MPDAPAGIARSAACALLLVLAVSRSTVAAEADPDALAPALRSAVVRAMEDYGVPGAVVGVFTRRGQWTAALGQADVASGRGMSRRDHFGVRSVGTSMVATLVLQLAAERRLGLQHPVSRYVDDVPRGDEITISHLLSMTSGLFSYAADEGFQRALAADPGRAWSTDELLAFAYQHDMQFDPGSAYQYSASNTLLLGKVVEQVTGQPLESVLRDRILRPLGLRNTVPVAGVELPPPAATGYQGTDEQGQPAPVTVNATAFGTAGGLASTLADLRRWGEALANGALLPARLQEKRLATRAAVRGPAYDRYGLGIGEIAGWWGHTGEGFGYAAAVLHQRDRSQTIVVLVNDTTEADVPALIFCRLLRVLGDRGGTAEPVRNPSGRPDDRPWPVCSALD